MAVVTDLYCSIGLLIGLDFDLVFIDKHPKLIVGLTILRCVTLLWRSSMGASLEAHEIDQSAVCCLRRSGWQLDSNWNYVLSERSSPELHVLSCRI